MPKEHRPFVTTKKKKPWKSLHGCVLNGDPGGIRTPDPRLRRPLLYPTELLNHLERAMGIEPTTSAWKAEVLPLNYTRNIKFSSGRSGRIRTCDPLFPRQVLYQAEPRPEHNVYYTVSEVKSQAFSFAFVSFKCCW